jgi:glyceraldehyde-3-phosphate dehydrogenase (NADP+)
MTIKNTPMATQDFKAILSNAFPALENIPQELMVDSQKHKPEYLLDGKILEWTGPLEDVRSPVCVKANGTINRLVIGQVPSMDETAAMEGLNAAVRAWNNGRGEWPTMSVKGRISAVEKFVVRMRQVREEVVKLLMWEIGKSLEDSYKEFDRTVDYITKTIEALKEVDRNNSRFSLDEGVIAQVRRSPLGVCLSMGPFNYPLNETYTTLIPALIMGNTLVVKPPKFGILLHQPLLPAFAECFPKGVVNFIYGSGSKIITPIIKSGLVDVLAFIGSSRVADTLKLQHPHPHRLRSILGLDAKNPALVMPDADIELAVRECVTGSLSFNGQRCTGLKLLFVHKSITEEFIKKLVAAVDSLPQGMPWEKGVKLTPLPEFNKANTLKNYVDDALAKGAKIMNQGGGEFFETLYRPAIVYPVTPEASLYYIEQFGPVIPVCSYSDEQEFLDFVTQSNYGQQLSLFGNDPKKIATLIDQLTNQVSRININCQCQRSPDTFPFTGRKDSAEGTLSISDALRCFSIRSLVATQANENSKDLVQQIVLGRYSSFLNTDFIL